MITLADHRARFWADCWMKVEHVEARAAKVGLAVSAYGFDNDARGWSFGTANDAMRWLGGYEAAYALVAAERAEAERGGA